MKVDIYTDGACSGNPGPGGWGAVLVCKGKEKQISGAQENTTNNQMELTAVIRALQQLSMPCEVVVTTDSKYVCDAINKGWLDNWIKNDWKKSNNKPVQNVELWKMLIALLEWHQVTFEWVKGHNGHYYNEICDDLATTAIKTLNSKIQTT